LIISSRIDRDLDVPHQDSVRDVLKYVIRGSELVAMHSWMEQGVMKAGIQKGLGIVRESWPFDSE